MKTLQSLTALGHHLPCDPLSHPEDLISEELWIFLWCEVGMCGATFHLSDSSECVDPASLHQYTIKFTFIWGSHSGDSEKYCLLQLNVV